MTHSIDGFINFCLDKFFAVHQLKETRDEKVFYPGDVVISCRKGSPLSIDWIGGNCEGPIFSHRVTPILNLMAKVIELEDAEFQFKMVLGPHDTLTKGDPCHRDISKVGFCCSLDSPHLTIPDPHYLSYVINPVYDSVRWDEKINRVVFRGTDGSMDRVNFSASSSDNPFIDSKISRFLSHDKDSLASLNIDIEKIEGNWLSHQDQLKYKYILDMYGHSIGWDRPCWGLPSNSIVILAAPAGPRSYTWYYPYIVHHKIIPEFTQEDLASRSSLPAHNDVLNDQQLFASALLDPATPYLFMKQFLLKYNEIFNS